MARISSYTKDTNITGNDKLDWIKFLSCLMVFCGVYLVTKRGGKKKFTANNS